VCDVSPDGGPVTWRVDDEGLPLEQHSRLIARQLARLLQVAEDVVLAVLSVVLLGIAAVVLVQTVRDLVTPPPAEQFAESITRGLNGVLFVLIVMEVLRTLVARFQGGGFRLQPFLVIGIISAVRHILTVGAQLSLVDEPVHLVRAMVELGVNVGVVLVLSLALVLIRRYAGIDEDEDR
jgi:uncharacterized membrane protein (DUF373 family)